MVKSIETTSRDSQAILAEDEALCGSNNKIRFYPIVADRAHGSTIIDPERRSYLDFGGGWAVAITGYSHPRVVDAVASQMERLSFAGYSTVPHQPAVELAQRLIDVTPHNGPRKVGFGLSGSDANEGVAKLLPIATGKPKLISFLGGMHGMSGASAGVSGHPALARFGGGSQVTRVPYPYPYRPPLGNAETCGREVVRFIEEQILTSVSPPEMTCGVLVESIQSDAGVIVPPDDFLPALRDLCDRHGLYLIDDEVKIGMGRTGKMWGCELTGTVPDILITGKGVASGQPLSAIVAPPEVLDAVPAGHAFTTAGAPVPCAAAVATIDAVQHEGLAGNAADLGNHLLDQFQVMAADHSLIGDVRGRGLILGIELVRDRKTKEPAAKETAKLALRCYQLGLLIHYVGLFSNVVELTPPLVLTRAEANQAIEILSRALTDVEENRVSDEDIAAYAGW
jgi:4-aminobutyrate aminotransferase